MMVNEKEIWKYTINGDTLTEQNKKDIKLWWSDNKQNLICFKGNGSENFKKHIETEYPLAIEVEKGVYTLEKTEEAG